MEAKKYELTTPQKSIYLLEKFYSGTNLNNICGTSIVHSKLDFDTLKKAINIVIKNNNSFTLHFVLENNTVKQYLTNYTYIDVEIVDIPDESHIQDIENAVLKKKFDIFSSENLYEFKIFRLPNNNGGFLLNIHHLLADSWTLGLTCKNIITAYNNLLGIEGNTVNSSSYIDFCIKEQEYINSEKFKKDKSYWNSVFETIPEIASIPSKNKNTNSSTSCSANRSSFTLENNLVDNINKFCKKYKISTFNFLTAIYSLYISRVTGLNDFVIGTPILNRTNFVEKNTTGMFINTVPLRISLTNIHTFQELISDISVKSLAMLRHQKYAYEFILDDLRKVNPHLPNLYNILLSYQITKANTDGVDYTTRWAFNNNSADELQIHISDLNNVGSLKISYDYKTEKFCTDEILQIHNRILHIINQVLSSVSEECENNKIEDIKLENIEIVTPDEKHKILESFNNTYYKYDSNKTIYKLFEEQVLKTPNNTAVVFEDSSLTYLELNNKSNQLANYLLNCNVKPGSVIGVLMNRSLELVISLLAILKTGCTYLPIDPDYPDDRINYMLEDSKTSVVLTNSNTSNILNGNNCKAINVISVLNKLNDGEILTNINNNISLFPDTDNLQISISTSQVMYLIYTSGSTGRPKGVMVTHKNVHNFILGMKNKIDFNENKTMVSLTTICFDIFGLEIWCSLTSGMKLVIANEFEQNNADLLSDLCLKNNVNMIQTTPSRFNMLLNNNGSKEFLKTITDILVGGESVPITLLQHFKSLTNAQIYNMYGPTETTIWSTVKNITNDSIISIGTPILNTQCYILDDSLNLLPPYTPGNLYIGGDGVSKGYLNRPDLTAQKFIKSPFDENNTIYNTNDLAYFTNSGDIMHLGRTDFQVKYKGYRIELGEIENVISKFDNILSCAVIFRNNNLYAFYTTKENATISVNDLKHYILSNLPSYMMPSAFYKLDKMPFTNNGKINRNSLQIPEITENKIKLLPKNEMEQKIFDLVSKISNNTDFSMDDDFFAIGLDSINIISLALEISNLFNITITSKEIINCASLLNLVEIIENKSFANIEAENNTTNYKITKCEKMDFYDLSSAQKRIYYATSMSNNPLVYNISGGLLINKILDANKVISIFNNLVQIHSSFRTCFKIVNDTPKQFVLDEITLDIPVITTPKDYNSKDIQLLVDNFAKPFSLESAPLLRIELHFINNSKTLILIDSHHIILDGTSLNILISEFCKLYNNMQLDEEKISYIDYSVFENNYIHSTSIEKLQNYWNNTFKNKEIPVINLPYDYPIVSNIKTFNGNKISTNISKETFDKIETIAKQFNVSPYVLCLSAFYVLLHKYTGQEDIIIGSPTAGRDFEGTEKLIGMFVNNIPLYANVNSNMNFKDFILTLKNTVLESLKNQPYSYDMLVKNLNLPSNTSIFDVMFIYQNENNNLPNIEDSNLNVLYANTKTSKFNLSLEIIPNEYCINLEYNTDLFKESTINRILENYIITLNSILNSSVSKISNIDVLSNDEKNKVLFDFNNTNMDYDKNTTIAKLFENQVIKTPNKIAITFENTSLTYNELNEKANQLAHFIRNKNITRNDVIGIMTTRSLELIISILAAFKCGCCYIPIDPNFPDERISYMLENSNSKILLTSKSTFNKLDFSSKLLINLEDENIFSGNSFNLNNINLPDDNSYIIYTSGSTGKPKGVEVSQQSVINHVYNVYNNYSTHFSDKDKTLSLVNSSFDVNVEEIFVPMFFGCTLHLISEDSIYDPRKIADYIYEQKITYTFIPPTILSAVYHNLRIFKNISLNKLLVGVQSIKNTILNMYLDLIPDLEIVNGYGPTEATIYCICKKYTYTNTGTIFNVPIGKPMDNCEIYLLNNTLTLQPFGYVGEICIAGECLSKGYLYNKEKTESSFIFCPNINKKIYRTGDYGYYLPNGDIMYVGRIDMQVKLNGYRIELSEIDEVISKYSNNLEYSYSLIHNKKIYSFIIGKEIDHAKLKQYLKTKLPYYMIPISFINIDKIPSTANGKINKDYLINILEESLKNKEKEIVMPSNKIEEYLINLLAKLLKLSPSDISIKDNFFELGGDSLSAIKICSSLQKDLDLNLPIKMLFELDTIQDIANYLSTTDTSVYYNIPKYEDNLEKYPISSAQKRVYLSSTIAKNNKLLYNMPCIIKLPNDINIKRLESSINTLIEKHESLRTYFIKDTTGIYQKVLPNAKIKLNPVYLKNHSIKSYTKTFVKEFDLSKAPLMRCELLISENNMHYLLLDMHHIISDGVSTNILVKDLSDIYNNKEIAVNNIKYTDYSIWENNAINNNVFKKEKEFWLDKVKNTDLLNLPTDYPRPIDSTYNGSRINFTIPRKIFTKIKYFCNQNNITPYMYMLGAFNILMYNFCKQETITLGTPVANRVLGKTSDIIGMFVNTLIMQSTIDSDMYIKKYYADLKNDVIFCFENQIYPFDELVNNLNVKRNSNNNNLFNTMFIYQNSNIPNIYFDDFETTITPINGNISKFDLSIEIIPNNKEFLVTFEYCTDLFKRPTIESLYKAYLSIVTYIAENHETKIKDIQLLNSDEKNKILYDFNNTSTIYPKNTDIYSLFVEQVENSPNKLAVFFDNESLSYQELNIKVSNLANTMRKLGVTQNDITAILVDKSLESIIAILATLKLGAAYLPIDVNYPTSRIDYMLADSKAKILLTTNDFVHKATNIITTLNISLDNTVIYTNEGNSDIIINQISTDRPAYIMYTSGSTGKPKGTIITQKNIIRLIKNTNFIKFREDDRIIQTGSIVFDACTFEIFGALLNGLPLYIIKKEDLLNPSTLQDFILHNKISIMWLTAPLFNQICEVNPHIFNTLRVLLTGGDVLSPKHINMARIANKNLSIINGYGPTENTTFSCCYNIDKIYTYSIPIGKPISNSTCYVVSDSEKLLPVGFPGELWVGGDGVCLGYLNNENLTNEKFMPNPFGLDTIYKTGDLVKWLPDGNISFINRIDSQVKINGYRVELKEIDIKLTSSQAIKEAFSMVRNINDEKCICSYIVCNEQLDLDELYAFLKESLPKYMLPKHIITLDKLPLNINGKIDKNQLPLPDENNITNRQIIEPSTQLEKTLLDIFKKILNKNEISVTDDFFEIGGDSLGAMKIQLEAMSNNIKIEYSDIFTHSSVRELANLIRNSSRNIENSQSGISIENENRYLSYNAFLQNNSIDNLKEVSYESLENILLTGFTGFLGAHILDSFLKKETGIIYCLIRDKDNLPAIERLKNTLNFYFENRYDHYIGNRIQVVNGDISDDNLGLSIEEYTSLSKNINAVIHSAALVKHYGTFKEFEKINIIGTKNIVKLCTDFDLKLIHVSTISVSGNVLAEQANVKNNFTEDKYYNETNFYIGQNIENLYVNSKFQGEDIVLNAISKGLRAYIVRMGNLTSRYSEGKFQQNHFENAFVNRLKSILQIGYAPEYLLKGYVEFTPIDYCGDAIIDLATHYNKEYSVFHLLNDNHVPMDRLCKELNEIGIPIKIVSSEKFKEIIHNLLKDENKKDYLQGIMNDFNEEEELVYESNVKIESEFTKRFLEKINFEWPYIDTNYLKNYFKYLSDIGYFNVHVK